MVKMDVIYADAEEKFVKNFILYGKSGDNYLYTDAACTEANRVAKDALMNICKKGLLISYEGTYYYPLMFKDNTTNVSVTFATTIAASTSDAITLYSKEYTA